MAQTLQFDLSAMTALSYEVERVTRVATVAPFVAWLNAFARADEPALRLWLRENTSGLVQVSRFFSDYIGWTERLFGQPWYGQEWVGVCQDRSFVAFLLELSDGELRDALVYELEEFEEFDEFLQQRGEVEGWLKPEEIPANTPSSHWWWWYPAPPPSP